MKLYIIGGTERAGINQEWNQYEKAKIVKFDTLTQQSEDSVSYISPPNVCPQENPSIIFKAGTMINNTLYVCTQTEILKYSLPGFNQTGYVSLPLFHDLHHVTVTASGNLLVANTGLDMVVECTETGKVVREWDVLNQKLWTRFSRDVDYRKILSTKPHHSHPNYLFRIEDDIWVTRCLQKDAVCLTNNKPNILIGGNMIHDGVVSGDKIYFTRVDGFVVVVSLLTRKVEAIHNLNLLSNDNEPLGWCRGIKVLDHEKVIVGFSRLRPTKKIDKNGVERKHGNFGVKPTHIACYDLRNHVLKWEFNMENHGLNAIYSIHLENHS